MAKRVKVIKQQEERGKKYAVDVRRKAELLARVQQAKEERMSSVHTCVIFQVVKAVDTYATMEKEKLAKVDRFKVELNKDKGKLKREIDEQKKRQAEEIKRQKITDMFKIQEEKQSVQAVKNRRRDLVCDIKKRWEDNIKAANQRRQIQIKQARDLELINIAQQLENKKKGLAKMQHVAARWDGNATLNSSLNEELDEYERMLAATLGESPPGNSRAPSGSLPHKHKLKQAQLKPHPLISQSLSTLADSPTLSPVRGPGKRFKLFPAL